MIQIHVIKETVEINQSGIALQNLNNSLDRGNFSGRIILSYDAGVLQGVKVEQTLKVKDLV